MVMMMTDSDNDDDDDDDDDDVVMMKEYAHAHRKSYILHCVHINMIHMNIFL